MRKCGPVVAALLPMLAGCGTARPAPAPAVLPTGGPDHVRTGTLAPRADAARD